MKRAIHLMDSYLHPMAKRAFGTNSKPETDQNTLKLAKWILEERPNQFTTRELQRTGILVKGNDATEIKEALLSLTTKNWVKASQQKNPKGGRPTIIYTVNPEAYK